MFEMNYQWSYSCRSRHGFVLLDDKLLSLSEFDTSKLDDGSHGGQSHKLWLILICSILVTIYLKITSFEPVKSPVV